MPGEVMDFIGNILRHKHSTSIRMNCEFHNTPSKQMFDAAQACCSARLTRYAASSGYFCQTPPSQHVLPPFGSAISPPTRQRGNHLNASTPLCSTTITTSLLPHPCPPHEATKRARNETDPIERATFPTTPTKVTAYLIFMSQKKRGVPGSGFIQEHCHWSDKGAGRHVCMHGTVHRCSDA